MIKSRTEKVLQHHKIKPIKRKKLFAIQDRIIYLYVLLVFLNNISFIWVK